MKLVLNSIVTDAKKLFLKALNAILKKKYLNRTVYE